MTTNLAAAASIFVRVLVNDVSFCVISKWGICFDGSLGLRSLDGEAGAGEASGAAVVGSPARLHPQPDHGEVVVGAAQIRSGRGGVKCDGWLEIVKGLKQAFIGASERSTVRSAPLGPTR